MHLSNSNSTLGLDGDNLKLLLAQFTSTPNGSGSAAVALNAAHKLWNSCVAPGDRLGIVEPQDIVVGAVSPGCLVTRKAFLSNF
jgi:hypothetical protein